MRLLYHFCWPYIWTFWYLMCKGLSGKAQKQPNSFCVTFKISRTLRFVIIFRFSYRLTTDRYSFRKDTTFSHVQSTLMIIKYVEVRNPTLVWRAGLDMGEGWIVYEEIPGHCQSVTYFKNSFIVFVVCLTVL